MLEYIHIHIRFVKTTILMYLENLEVYLKVRKRESEEWKKDEKSNRKEGTREKGKNILI